MNTEHVPIIAIVAVAAVILYWPLFQGMVLRSCNCWCGPGKCECSCGCKSNCACFRRSKEEYYREYRNHAGHNHPYDGDGW